jgi:metal-dependent amidase/aminoacylase/carboxypeptidase family protein
MAGTCTFEITVRGHGCHAAMPHQGVDTLVVSSQLVLALQTVVARNAAPLRIGGGQRHPDSRRRGVEHHSRRCRSARHHPQLQRRNAGTCRARRRAAVQRHRGAFGAQISVRFDHRYPPTVNSVARERILPCRWRRLLGPDKVRTNELPSMGAEDFAYMLREKPGCYVWLGNGPGTGGCTLHNPHYDFNDEILPLGVSYWVRLVRAPASWNVVREA